MSTKIFIDPVTRLEGHLKIAVTVNEVNGQQQVVDARASGTLFRGFEQLLVGRDPRDAQHLTQRICGVCPVPHGMASVMAQDAAFQVTAPTNARIMRNLVLGANFVQSHILHFYHLTALDYIDGPAMAPWQPSWKADKRITGAAATDLVNHYVTAIDMTRKAHEMGALFGGRMPDPAAYIAGGFTTTPRADRISKYKAYLNELLPFIQNVYLPDVAALRSVYSDYNTIGRGYGNLLAFGVFDLNSSGSSRLLSRGRSVNGSTTVNSVDLTRITESVRYSWYEDSTTNLNPVAGQTLPHCPKAKAYSWLKAPRYDGAPYEAGPLARMWVNGDYRQGISVMDRHQARAQETLKIAQALQTWVNQLHHDRSGLYQTYDSVHHGLWHRTHRGPPRRPGALAPNRFGQGLELSDHYPHLLERLSPGRCQPDGPHRKGPDGHAGQRPERTRRGPEGHSFLRPLPFLRGPCLPTQ